MKNKFDKNGNRQGLWERYYPNGKLWRKGAYKNGIYHGLWNWYYPDGSLWCKGAFKREIRVGLWHHPGK